MSHSGPQPPQPGPQGQPQFGGHPQGGQQQYGQPQPGQQYGSPQYQPSAGGQQYGTQHYGGQQYSGPLYGSAPNQTQAQVPSFITANATAIKHGAIAGAAMYGIALVTGLLTMFLALLAKDKLSAGEIFASLVIAAGNVFGSGTVSSFGTDSHFTMATYMTGAIIVGLAVFFILRKIRQGKAFDSAAGFWLATGTSWVVVYLLHVVVGLLGSLGAENVRPGYGLAFLTSFMVVLAIMGLYQIFHVEARGLVSMWLLRIREVLPYAFYLMLAHGVIMLLAILIETIVAPSYGIPSGGTVKGGVVLAALFALGDLVLGGPALVVGLPFTDEPIDFSLFSVFPAWLTIITVILGLGAGVAIALWMSKKLPPAPFIRTGVIAGVFFVIAIYAIIFARLSLVGLISSGPISPLAILVYPLWGVAIELISRFAGPIMSTMKAGASASAPSQFGAQQFGGQPGYGQQPQFGHQNGAQPQFGQPGQPQPGQQRYGQQPQYGPQPQYGQQPQFGSQPAGGQQTHFGQPQPGRPQPGQPQGGQPQPGRSQAGDNPPNPPAQQ